MTCSILLFLLLCLVQCSAPASILAVVPTLSVSHFGVFEPLLATLVQRGHSLVVVSGYPLNVDESYKHIDIKEAKKKFNGSWSLSSFSEIPAAYKDIFSITSEQVKENENIFRLESVQRLLKSGEKFDLIIVEQFISDVFLGFVDKFKAPFLTLSPCPSMPWAMDRLGAPANLAVEPNLFSGYSSKMGFSQRLANVIQVIYAKIYQQFVLNRISEDMAKTYFGSSVRRLEDIVKNSRLFLVNSHFSLFTGRALPPQVVEVGGIHVLQPKPLHQELDRWMNESVHGVVYFSFGSMLRGATLPADKVAAFLQVFGTLKQRVLWKWEDDALENLPPNVRIMKWLPQRDVLAHPKVKVFISHGGLLGTTEAIVSAVPILGIPMYGDQPNNVAALVERGVAVHVDYNNISVESLAYALDALLHDDRYSKNAKLLSSQFLDRPQTPLETAVYWTEYVIRHRGAPHLQSAAVHLTWYQYYLLDVVAACLAALAAILTVVFLLIRSCYRLVFSTKSTKLKRN